MGERSYKKCSFLKAAALALALAIGANGAIFSLEGLNRSGEIFPNPISLLFESDAAQSNVASENTEGRNALLLGCYRIALNAYPVGASIIQAIAGKAR